MSDKITIWWMRQDLRLADNPALVWAAERGKVVAVYIAGDEARALGGASNWWLEQSLLALGKEIPVVRRVGDAAEVLAALIEETGADAVVWNRCYEPWAVKRDTEVKAFLKDEAGVEVHSFNSALLFEPWEVKTQGGTDFKVFTPFWKACLQKEVAAPCPAPTVEWVKAKSEEVRFYPVAGEPDWAKGWDEIWVPGEAGAAARLKDFLKTQLAGYGEGRNFPAKGQSSRLSANLHFGEIGPRQVWASAKKVGGKDAEKFLSELGWREFCHHILWHFPELAERNWKGAFDAYPWRQAPKDLEAWKLGMTGYPLVDAGMRELWQTGYMHNRVRMVVASFLIKHLRIDWREGEQWFWETLVDADGANNAASWQWVAGSGADASPYFRIFNPTAQAERFDGEQAYIKKWVPEVGTATYVKPIVVHEAARKAALEGYEKVKGFAMDARGEDR